MTYGKLHGYTYPRRPLTRGTRLTDKKIKEILKGIKEFFFVDILEDPFILRDEKGTFFQWSFRLVDVNGLSLVSEIPVYMHKNPFGRRQFFISFP